MLSLKLYWSCVLCPALNIIDKCSLFESYLKHLLKAGNMLHMSVKIKSAEASRKSLLNYSQAYCSTLFTQENDRFFSRLTPPKADKLPVYCVISHGGKKKSFCLVSEPKCSRKSSKLRIRQEKFQYVKNARTASATQKL